MICSNCKTENNNENTVCSNCGSLIIKSEMPIRKNQPKNDLKKVIIVIFVSLILITGMGMLGYKLFLENYDGYDENLIDDDNDKIEIKVENDGYEYMFLETYNYKKTDEGYFLVNSDENGYYVYLGIFKESYSMDSITLLQNNLINNGFTLTSQKKYKIGRNTYTVFTGTLYGKNVNVVYTGKNNNSVIGYIIPRNESLFKDSLEDFNDIVINIRKNSEQEPTLSISYNIPKSLEISFD